MMVALLLCVVHLGQQGVGAAGDEVGSGATVAGRIFVPVEDVIETLLGIEIMDEMDKVEDMQLFARQRWQSRFGSATPS
jgi:Mg2+/Co2+ transporter CorC